jgi:hypothetical protein
MKKLSVSLSLPFILPFCTSSIYSLPWNETIAAACRVGEGKNAREKRFSVVNKTARIALQLPGVSFQTLREFHTCPKNIGNSGREGYAGKRENTRVSPPPADTLLTPIYHRDV